MMEKNEAPEYLDQLEAPDSDGKIWQQIQKFRDSSINSIR